MTRTGVHSGLEKHRSHQEEEPRSPDLRRSNFCFCTCIHKREVMVEVHRCAGSKRKTFSCKGYFFQIVILNTRLWFAFSPPSLCTRLGQGIDM